MCDAVRIQLAMPSEAFETMSGSTILVPSFLIDVYACFAMTIGKHDCVERIPQ
ncbi:hypothetical protein Tco_0035081, partial [Tanacetum coccineum]